MDDVSYKKDLPHIYSSSIHHEGPGIPSFLEIDRRDSGMNHGLGVPRVLKIPRIQRKWYRFNDMFNY